MILDAQKLSALPTNPVIGNTKLYTIGRINNGTALMVSEENLILELPVQAFGKKISVGQIYKLSIER